jgi:adenine/guanine phosphoribosyltransferase-like PRPP-binding protein
MAIASASHLQYLFQNGNLQLAVKAMADQLKDHKFDTIVATGISGISVGPMVASILGKQIAIIRKPGERRYSEFKVEFVGALEHSIPGLWVFLDDLLVTGTTFQRVVKVMKAKKSSCIGIALYNTNLKVGYLTGYLGDKIDVPILASSALSFPFS